MSHKQKQNHKTSNKTEKMQDEVVENKTKGENKEKQPKMTKLEQKIKFNEQKRVMKEVWTTEMESDELDTKDGVSVPSHYKRYTIQDQKIIVQQPVHEKQKPRESYKGPENAKRIDLEESREEPKPTYIATNLSAKEEELLIAMLK